MKIEILALILPCNQGTHSQDNLGRKNLHEGGFKIDHLLDLRSLFNPFTLLKATQALRVLKSGETMEILAEDLETKNDLFKVLPSSLYTLIEIKEEEAIYRILLKKT